MLGPRATPLSWRREAPSAVDLPPGARILVVKAAGIGDLLLAVPALRALRKTYPNAHVDVLVTPQAAPLLRDASLVDRVLVVDKAPFDNPRALSRAPWRLWPLLRVWRGVHGGRYDAVLLLHHLTLPFGRLKYRLLLQAARPALRVGLDNGHGAFLDVQVPDRGFGARHEAEYCLDVAAAAGAQVEEPLTGPSLADLGWTDEQLGVLGPVVARAAGPLVALHPGSGTYSVARRWPLEHYAKLARALHDAEGATVAVVGGAEDGDLALRLVELLGGAEWAVPLPPGASLRELAHFLGRCSLFVGNDSLPLHLAAAAGTPVVGIFGPSNHRAWRPLPRVAGGFAEVVRRDLACSPCFYRGHDLGTPQGCPARSCLTQLDVADVLAQARRGMSAGRAVRTGERD